MLLLPATVSILAQCEKRIELPLRPEALGIRVEGNVQPGVGIGSQLPFVDKALKQLNDARAIGMLSAAAPT